MFFSLLFEILMNNKFLFHITYNPLPQYIELLLRVIFGTLILNANIGDFFDMESFFWFFNVFFTLCPLGAGRKHVPHVLGQGMREGSVPPCRRPAGGRLQFRCCFVVASLLLRCCFDAEGTAEPATGEGTTGLLRRSIGAAAARQRALPYTTERRPPLHAVPRRALHGGEGGRTLI